MSDPALSNGNFLTAFGQYVLSPEIFKVLGEHVRNNVRHRGAFQLTQAVDSLRRDHGLVGVLVEAERSAIGAFRPFGENGPSK